MVAFNFGDAIHSTAQSFDVNWFRFAKSCMVPHHVKEFPIGSFGAHEFLRSDESSTRIHITWSANAPNVMCLGAEAFGRIIVFIQDGVELMFF